MIQVRHARDGDLPALAELKPSRQLHADRLDRQARGDCTYLVASRSGVAIGHVLVKWIPELQSVHARARGCPEVEDLLVLPEARNQGAGAQLLEAAEEEARRRGFERLGLAVGLTAGYAPARHLYARRGYADAGVGEFTQRWQFVSDAGVERSGEELLTYLVKEL